MYSSAYIAICKGEAKIYNNYKELIAENPALETEIEEKVREALKAKE